MSELVWKESVQAGRNTWELVLYDAKLWVALSLESNEYCVQLIFRGAPLLGRTFRGEFLGYTTEMTLEEVQAEALERTEQVVSEMLSSIHEAMKISGAEVEPLTPDGALDHKGQL